MTTSDQVVTKGRFAELCNVSPGRVTQWIDEGKISGDALVGTGRKAQIKVAVAQRQLKLRRDVGQALGNGLDTRLDAKKRPPPVEAPTAAEDDDGAPIDPESTGDDNLDVALKRAKLRALCSAQRKADEDEAARQGRFVDTTSVRRQMGIVAAQTMRVFEGALPEVATSLAARFAIDDREALQHLNEIFRTVRAQAAERAAAAAAVLPSLVADGAAEEPET